MICLIDSGIGGLLVYKELKKIRPELRVIYVADNKNFPYGIKSPEEILDAVKDIEKGLKTFCLEKITIACHTASIVLENSPTNFSLITTTTKKLINQLHERGSVAILGSRATIESGYYQKLFFEKGFEKIQGFPLQDLIGLIENQITEESLLIKALEPLIAFSPEILLLGSTHYPYLETLLVKLFPFSKIVNPSSQFALEISANVLSPSKNDLDEDLFITTKHDPGFLRRLQKNPINNLLKKDVKRV
ncbi:hypothetical protein EB008_03065 [bacterium]|nr:hypothetical protein [bacterium]